MKQAKYMAYVEPGCEKSHSLRTEGWRDHIVYWKISRANDLIQEIITLHITLTVLIGSY